MPSRTLRLMLLPRSQNNVIFAPPDPALVADLVAEAALSVGDGFVQVLDVTVPPRWRLVGPDGTPVIYGPTPPDFPLASASIEIAVSLDGPDLDAWLDAYAERLSRRTDAEVHADLPIGSTLYASGAAFGTNGQVRTMIRIDALPPVVAKKRVNVVIVDQGFEGSRFGAKFGGGFDAPGRAPGKGSSPHAAMIASIVHDLAPDAFLYDCPLVPTPAKGASAVLDLPAFTSDARALFAEMFLVIMSHQRLHAGSWVIVNPWAVFDSRSDSRLFPYTTSRQHPLNRLAIDLASLADLVFSAGNCGLFGPDNRCGPNDRGPCRSILGTNSLDEVLTVGAVRTDRTALAYSSQGPSATNRARAKPDLYAPSQFRRNGDHHTVNGGTSAAAAVAGGVVAALRSGWDTASVGPAALAAALAGSASALPGNPGAGLVDATAAAALLPPLP